MTTTTNTPRSQLAGILLTITISISITGIYLVSKSIYNKRYNSSSGNDGNNRNDSDRLKNSKNNDFDIIQDDAVSGALETIPRGTASFNSLGLEQPLVIAMVGLPARGKSYIVKMIIRYLSWTGFESEVFNVGSYRRKIGLQSADAAFFDPQNKEGNKTREEMAMSVQEEMYTWLHEEKDGFKRRVAIFDATNSTKARRYALAQKARKENVFLLFVESICNDETVLRQNYEMKLQNDDYKGMNAIDARRDFLERVKAYELAYETLQDDEDHFNISYIQLINVGQKVITRNCTGYLPSQVAFYLQNVHITPRKIYLTLNAQSYDVVENLSIKHVRGKDTGKLTEEGRQYSLDLAKFIQSQENYTKTSSSKTASATSDTSNASNNDVLILAGTANIHLETVLHLRCLYSCYNTPLLNELRGGDMHGLSVDEIKAKFPNEYEKRNTDKLNYRYPGVGGESYMDVIERIRPIIIELERQRRSVVIVCHLAVLRCIYAYFMGVKLEEIPYKQFKRHRVYELTPGPFGTACAEFNPQFELLNM